mgnify:FL=1
MKHKSFSTPTNSLHLQEGCSERGQTKKVWEIFLWLIFLMLLGISVFIFLPVFDDPDILMKSSWQWYCLFGTLAFTVGYFLFLLFSF